MKPTIQTSGGGYFNFLEPEKSVFDINEIAHALSHICRFTGHTNTFYSVAQHAYLASYLVEPQHALAALMHDAAEAYIGDCSAPLKQLLPDFREIEAKVEAAIFTQFGIPFPFHPSIKQADLIMLATEQRDLMPKSDDSWACLAGIRPAKDKIRPLSPKDARELFLSRFFCLTYARKDLNERRARL